MKKLIVIALLAIGFSGIAQDGLKKNGKEMSKEMRLKKMTEELALNTDQQKQISVILEEQSIIRKSAKENKDKMRENMQKMKSILTPEQLEKMKANRQKHNDEKKCDGKHMMESKPAE